VALAQVAEGAVHTQYDVKWIAAIELGPFLVRRTGARTFGRTSELHAGRATPLARPRLPASNDTSFGYGGTVAIVKEPLLKVLANARHRSSLVIPPLANVNNNNAYIFYKPQMMCKRTSLTDALRLSACARLRATAAVHETEGLAATARTTARYAVISTPPITR
jgi:hypothetical protein